MERTRLACRLVRPAQDRSQALIRYKTPPKKPAPRKASQAVPQYSNIESVASPSGHLSTAMAESMDQE
ncbi:hypothetical protein EI77_04609 [Prosthecobacter fusiformis]|uniref:Uncharacterized protein n=1 Tax=Prosthecobacter fusiformis TaxID=48464 RepID=A0A4R7RJU0_9BACT|nr:hypothetical protein EI77_04609 [Prosthecobacter fusiformis]